jgi:hypothetical protein
MNWLKKIKSFAALVFVLSFLFSASLSSCGNKGQAGEKESTEHPAEEKSEHPEGGAKEEHPKDDKNDSDSTRVEQTPK